MSNEDTRKRFEAWASGPPYECSVQRYGEDSSKYAWPGSYKHAATQLAWHAWQAAVAAEREACKKKCEEIRADLLNRYLGIGPYEIFGKHYHDQETQAKAYGAEACSDAIAARSEKGGGE